MQLAACKRQGLCKELRAAKQQGAASLPVYSRERSDPVPDGVVLERTHRCVLVEGNYLLLTDEPWRELWDGDGALLDERWFVATTVDDAMARVTRRHVAVGRTPEEARARADGNDRPNGELVWASRDNADVIVPSYEWEGAKT